MGESEMKLDIVVTFFKLSGAKIGRRGILESWVRGLNSFLEGCKCGLPHIRNKLNWNLKIIINVFLVLVIKS